MLNDRIVMRVAMLFALAVLPSLASSQASQSSQAKAPDWYGKEVTQITIDGSSEQLKAFQEELQKTFIKSGLDDKTVFPVANQQEEEARIFIFDRDREEIRRIVRIRILFGAPGLD